MTNLQSIAGGFAWMFTALVLIAATLEPVQVKGPQLQLAGVASAAAKG